MVTADRARRRRFFPTRRGNALGDRRAILPITSPHGGENDNVAKSLFLCRSKILHAAKSLKKVMRAGTPRTPILNAVSRPPQTRARAAGRCLSVGGRVRGGKLAPSATLSAASPIFRPCRFFRARVSVFNGKISLNGHRPACAGFSLFSGRFRRLSWS